MGVATAARVEELIADDNKAIPAAETEVTTKCDSIDPPKAAPVESGMSIAMVSHRISQTVPRFDDTVVKAAQNVRSPGAAIEGISKKISAAAAATKTNEARKSSAKK
jgi:hypothetical protein